MLIFVYILILLIVSVWSYFKFKTWINIVTLFTGIWCFFGVLSTFGLYGLRQPVLAVHCYAWLFVITVDFVILIFCNKKFVVLLPTQNKQGNNEEACTIVKKKTYTAFVQILSLLLYSPMMLNAFQTLLTLGFADIRLAYYSSDYADAYLFSLLCRTAPVGLMYGLIIYYVYTALKERQFKYFVYAFLNAGIITMVNGGRYALLQVLFSAVIVLVMKQQLDKKDAIAIKKFKKRIRRGIIIVAGVLLLTTVLRNQAIIKNFVTYYSGSLSFLDYIIDHPRRFDLNERLNGYMTFGAITEPTVLGLKMLGLTTAKTPSYLFNIPCQEFYDIGNGTSTILFNANTTVIYYFLRDFGVGGIVVGGILLGSVVVIANNKWKRGNEFHALIYVYMCVVLLNSIMTYQLFGCNVFFSFLAMYLCTKPRVSFVAKKTSKLCQGGV